MLLSGCIPKMEFCIQAMMLDMHTVNSTTLNNVHTNGASNIEGEKLFFMPKICKIERDVANSIFPIVAS